jgi:hypothetical protein
MCKHLRRAALTATLSLLATAAAAQSAGSTTSWSCGAGDKPEATLRICLRPVAIDRTDQPGATLGLGYRIDYLKSLGGGGQTSKGEPVVSDKDADVVLRDGQLAARLRGTFTATRQKNPHKLIDLTGSWQYAISTRPARYYVGADLAFETDQSFENKQFALGLTGAVTKGGIVHASDAGTVILSLARVDPRDVTAREEVEGSLRAFNRWNLEASYSVGVSHRMLRSIDFDYRHYQELSPSRAIRAAGLDRNRQGLVRLNLDRDFFVQYSRGSLPFDQRAVRAVTMGWSMKLD